MARKSTSRSTGKRKPSASTKKGQNGESRRIRGTLLLRYKAAAAEWSESRILLDQGATRLHAEKAKPIYAPLVKLLEEQQQLLNEYQRRVVELKRVQEDIATKLGVTDLKGFLEGHVIDTETGEVKPVISESP